APVSASLPRSERSTRPHASCTARTAFSVMAKLMAMDSVSSAVEDYAKAIYALETRGEGAAVSTNAIAERLGVTAASASNMVKKLDTLGLVRHVPYRGVQLTPEGVKVALEVIRHHRLLELYLAE